MPKQPKLKVGKFSKLELAYLEKYAQHPVEDLQEIANLLNRNLASVEKQLVKLQVNTQDNPIIQPTEFDLKMEELKREVAVLKAQNPKPEERKAVIGTRAKSLMGRREGIAVMTESASEEFDFQSKIQHTYNPNQSNIFQPGKPDYPDKGPTIFDPGRRF